MYLFFFFKQKTAYEMRISDWSSDVCSSDLPPRPQALREHAAGRRELVRHPDPGVALHRLPARQPAGRKPQPRQPRGIAQPQHADQLARRRAVLRSEEHTSELQSLMRISYAVFCLKKKT